MPFILLTTASEFVNEKRYFVEVQALKETSDKTTEVPFVSNMLNVEEILDKRSFEILTAPSIVFKIPTGSTVPLKLPETNIPTASKLVNEPVPEENNTDAKLLTNMLLIVVARIAPLPVFVIIDPIFANEQFLIKTSLTTVETPILNTELL